MIAASRPDGYAACCEASVAMTCAADLGRIAAPTLVLSGAQDQASTPAMGRAIAAGIPAPARTIEGAAHLANSSARPSSRPPSSSGTWRG